MGEGEGIEDGAEELSSSRLGGPGGFKGSTFIMVDAQGVEVETAWGIQVRVIPADLV